jgi:predicted nucleic acid-binding protein
VTTFVDTSALLAVVSGDDEAHAPARKVWEDLLGRGEDIITTNYAVVECHALVQRRFGMEGVRLLESAFLPALSVLWVEPPVHRAAAAAVLAADSRELSLVDCVSFHVMRMYGIARAFTFDSHFATEGFEVVPPVEGPSVPR